MHPPVFPLSIEEVKAKIGRLDFHTVYDGMSLAFRDQPSVCGNDIKIDCLKQNHPQETYGWRIEYLGKVFAFGADNEPFAGFEDPDPNLVELFRGADVGVNDGQYSFDQYLGKKEAGGLSRRGWGHAFPESNAHLIVKSGVRRFYTTHHDPASKDKRIWQLASRTKELVDDIRLGEANGPGPREPIVEAAHEGLTINVLE